jgi:hypothetical protein
MTTMCARRVGVGATGRNREAVVNRRKQDVEKARFWLATIREAARSGMSIRKFCRRRKLHEGQFYWWQRRLSVTRQAPRRRNPRAVGPASFALVSEEPSVSDAGIELVLAGGRRLRIARGVDEATLRAVLAAVDPAGC